MSMPGRAWKKFVASRVGRSIFRVGIPSSNLERARAGFSSFLLHIQPVKVRKRSLRFKTTMGLGLITLYLFIILTISGVLLMFYYIPAPDLAYQSMKDLEFVVTAGMLLRNMHRWSAHLMVVFVVLHMCRVFYTAAYKEPREFNWVIGITLLLLTVALSFTGYLLPWDQLAFWAITVGTSIAAYAPVFGEKLKFVLLGGHEVGQAALIRFYVLHVIVLPGIAAFLVAIHLWRVRKDGGLARPTEPADVHVTYEPTAVPTNKTYGLMELAHGTGPAVGVDPDEEVFSWPHLIFRELLVFLFTLAMVLLLSLQWDAPLEQIANPAHPPNPSKAPWYFLGLQELVAHSAFWGGVFVPTAVVVALVVLPYIDTRPTGVGVWFSRERKWALCIFTICLFLAVTFTVIGSLFRGANWDFVVPWSSPAGGGH